MQRYAVSSRADASDREDAYHLAQVLGVSADEEWYVGLALAKDPARDPGGACCAPAHSPFCLRLRDQMRLKVSPSATRLA
jgi:hypothetical protein